MDAWLPPGGDVWSGRPRPRCRRLSSGAFLTTVMALKPPPCFLPPLMSFRVNPLAVVVVWGLAGWGVKQQKHPSFLETFTFIQGNCKFTLIKGMPAPHIQLSGVFAYLCFIWIYALVRHCLGNQGERLPGSKTPPTLASNALGGASYSHTFPLSQPSPPPTPPKQKDKYKSTLTIIVGIPNPLLWLSVGYWPRAHQSRADTSFNHTTGSVLFLSWCTFLHRELEILAHFDQFMPFCRIFSHIFVYFSGLNNVTVYQNGQISGIKEVIILLRVSWVW